MDQEHDNDAEYAHQISYLTGNGFGAQLVEDVEMTDGVWEGVPGTSSTSLAVRPIFKLVCKAHS